MRVVLSHLVIAALLFAGPVPVRADDAAAVVAKLTNAAAAVTSFVVQMRINGTTGDGGTMTFVRPMRMKTEFSVGTTALESYLVDGVVYVNTPSLGWRKSTVDKLHALPQSMNIAESLDAAQVNVLPNRQEDGDTVGVISIDEKLPASAAPPGTPAPAQHMVCSYDRASYRMRTCASTMMTMKYVRYNDPANVVVLPPEAQNAEPMTLPAPGPGVRAPAPGGVSPGAAAPDAAPSPRRQ